MWHDIRCTFLKLAPCSYSPIVQSEHTVPLYEVCWRGHFNIIISCCLSLAGKHCLQLKCNTAEMQHSRMQKQCLRSVPGSSKVGLMHKASLPKYMANCLHMCDNMLYMNTTQGNNMTATDCHLCEHVTQKLSRSPESDYNLPCNECEGASQFNSLSDCLYAV